jgi:hypothetical protein
VPVSRIVGGVTSSLPHDSVAALNQALSELIDELPSLKQARRLVRATDQLRGLLDRLFDDLRVWAGLLMDRDDALGVSPLAFMPSVAGRKQPNLFPGVATDDDVRRVVGEQLDRLARHVAEALAEQDDDSSRAALAEVERGLMAYRHALSEP